MSDETSESKSADNSNLSLVSECAVMNTAPFLPSRVNISGREDVKA